MGQTDTEKEILINRVGNKNYSRDFTDECPRHKVCVDGFWMARYETTNKVFRRFKPNHNSGKHIGKSLNSDPQPVVQVSWQEANAFAGWLTRTHGMEHKFRLPTEAEWEYACRAGSDTMRYWSDNPDVACQYANVHDRTSKLQNQFKWTEHNCNDGFAVTAPVGEFEENAFGLHDMLGNVWEWCEDTYYSDTYDHHAVKNPKITGDGYNVIRGGGWINNQENIRCAIRGGDLSGSKNIDLGFRLVKTP